MQNKYFSFSLLISLLLASSFVTSASLNSVQLIDLAGKPIPNAIIELNVSPSEPATRQTEYSMDQVNFEFVPEVLIIPRDAFVRFPNSDDSRHHVYSFSETKQFELKLFSGNQAPPVQFDKTGAVSVGCNIHDRMNGYIYVTDYPIAIKTDSAGVATLPEFEAHASQEFQVWHPLLMQPLKFKLNNIDIDSNGNTTLSLPIALPEVEDNSSPLNSLKSRLKSYKNNGD